MVYFNASVVSIILTILLGVWLIPVLKKRKAKQVILEYVVEHSEKNGTPTMGGVIIIAATLATSLLFCGVSIRPLITGIIIAFGMGFIGFLDDFIKIFYKRNLGLKAYQKIISQSVLGLVLAIYCCKYTNGEIFVPFLNKIVIIGNWTIPLVFISFIALVNTVNLTDGLDGLAATTSAEFLFGMVVVLAVMLFQSVQMNDIVATKENSAFLILSVSLLGSLLAFLFFNAYPAKVFMGDTGSLFIGAMLTVIATLTKNTLFILCFGLPFVISGLSDIIQVAYFKITKGKRVFKMAPFHHHLQKSGIHENRIVKLYFIVSFVAILITLSSFVGGIIWN
ncbi:MAG: phospho-N-acetylmuramoyl-pentapeptide-transferase [Clostridia bacterium]